MTITLLILSSLLIIPSTSVKTECTEDDWTDACCIERCLEDGYSIEFCEDFTYTEDF